MQHKNTWLECKPISIMLLQIVDAEQLATFMYE